MKSYILFIICICILFTFTSCDLVSNSDSDNTKVADITGTVQGQDQSTPIHNATVFVGESLSDNANGKIKMVWKSPAKTEHCEEPPVEFDAYTCTNPDGSYEFEVEIPADAEELELKIFKGTFSVTQTVEVSS